MENHQPYLRRRIKLLQAFAAILLVYLLACQKQDAPPSKKPATQSDSSHPAAATETNPGNSGHSPSALSFPRPDADSFFPLLQSSYWVYETFQDGKKLNGLREVDSVLNLVITDSGFLATVQVHTLPRGNTHVLYRVDAKGLVWRKEEKDQAFQLYADLQPKAGENIGGLNAAPCNLTSDSIGDCVEFQNFRADDDSLSDTKRREWQGIIFKRGIGLNARAGFDFNTEVVEYRIGRDGSVITTTDEDENGDEDYD